MTGFGPFYVLYYQRYGAACPLALAHPAHCGYRYCGLQDRDFYDLSSASDPLASYLWTWIYEPGDEAIGNDLFDVCPLLCL